MAISTYSQLKTAVSDWMARTDVAGSAADFITLAEARFNRMLGPVSQTAKKSTSAGVPRIDVSDLDIAKPIALWLMDGDREYCVPPRANGAFPASDYTGLPTAWTTEGNYLIFDRPCDGAYDTRFIYQGRFGLSDTVVTNELLLKHPDIYLAASIVWGSMYIKDAPSLTVWQQMLTEFEAQVKSYNAQRKRSVLSVDPMLGRTGCGIGNLFRAPSGSGFLTWTDDEGTEQLLVWDT